MKILFCPAHYVYDEYHGGSEQYAAFTIADRLARQYPGSVVITGKKKILSEKTYRIVEAHRNASRDMTFFKAIVFTIAYTIAGLRVIRKERFDIFHHVRPFKIGSTFNMIALLGFTRNTPFIIGAFASPYDDEAVIPHARVQERILSRVKGAVLALIQPILAKLSTLTLKRADRIIVYDQYTKDLVARFTTAGKIVVIPPGKDGILYRRPAAARQRKSRHVNFLAVGYLNPRKNVRSLIRAFEQVVDAYPAAHLTIVGDGEERRDLEALTSSLRLEEHVRFAGFVENRHISEYYFAADIFVHAAYEESFGQVYLEAMASEVPILTTNTRGARQILEHKKTAYFAEGADVASLSRAMLLLNNAELRQTIAENAHRTFTEQYDWNSVIPKYRNLYDQLLREIKSSK